MLISQEVSSRLTPAGFKKLVEPNEGSLFSWRKSIINGIACSPSTRDAVRRAHFRFGRESRGRQSIYLSAAICSAILYTSTWTCSRHAKTPFLLARTGPHFCKDVQFISCSETPDVRLVEEGEITFPRPNDGVIGSEVPCPRQLLSSPQRKARCSHKFPNAFSNQAS